jgi:hypothetical protein
VGVDRDGDALQFTAGFELGDEVTQVVVFHSGISWWVQDVPGTGEPGTGKH